MNRVLNSERILAALLVVGGCVLAAAVIDYRAEQRYLARNKITMERYAHLDELTGIMIGLQREIMANQGVIIAILQEDAKR